MQLIATIARPEAYINCDAAARGTPRNDELYPRLRLDRGWHFWLLLVEAHSGELLDWLSYLKETTTIGHEGALKEGRRRGRCIRIHVLVDGKRDRQRQLRSRRLLSHRASDSLAVRVGGLGGTGSLQNRVYVDGCHSEQDVRGR